MFRDDFEFNDAAGPSHHGGGSGKHDQVQPTQLAEQTPDNVIWLSDAERELKKIPFFVRGKARRNTEFYAAEKGVSEISVDTLYEAKAHFAR